MSVFEPLVTELSPGTDDMTGIITELQGYSWTNFSVPSQVAGEGLIIRSTADPDPLGVTGWDVSVRRDGAGGFVTGIDPNGGLTSGGTGAGPTGTSANWSGETSETNGVGPTPPNWVTQSPTSLGVGAGSRYWLIELIDAFFLMITDPTDTWFDIGFHAGKIYRPADVDDFGNGRDGLGWMLGSPEPVGGFSTNQWGSSTSVSVYSSVVRTAAAEWEPLRLPLSISSLNVSSAGAVVKPARIPVAGGQNRSTLANVHVGDLKYVRAWHINKSPKVRHESNGVDNQAWVHVEDNNAASRQLIPWRVGVTN
jgi:hypothetical protein